MKLWFPRKPGGFKVFGRRVVIGLNGEPSLWFGIHRERLFTAIGFWPLLIGIERKR